MSKALKNMRKSVEHVVSAFLRRQSAKAGHTARGVRYMTDGTAIYQWGNLVAERVPDGIRITDAGWHSSTTKQMLNSILDMVGASWRIAQEKFEWKLYNYHTREERPWKGSAIIKTEGGTVEANRRRRRGKKHTCASNRCCPNGKKWVLQSSPMIHAPGLIKWIQHGYATSSGKQKKMFAGLIAKTWAGVPRAISEKIAARRQPISVRGDSVLVDTTGRFESNMMSLDEARFLIAKSRAIIREPKARWSKFALGQAAGMSYAVGAAGPLRTSRRAVRIQKAAEKAAGVLPNHAIQNISRAVRNLHTRGEREFARRLLMKYWHTAKRGLRTRKKAVVAHAYGAISSIKRLARQESPRAGKWLVDLSDDLLRSIKYSWQAGSRSV